METISSEICRVCESDVNLIDILMPLNRLYIDQYLACANVTFEIGDGLPQFICKFCINQLGNAYRFKRQCELTQKKHKNMLMSHNPLTKPNKKEVEEEQNLDEDNYEIEWIDNAFGDDDDNNDVAEKLSNKKGPRKFQCDICHTKYQTKHRIEMHMHKIHGSLNISQRCPYCLKIFDSSESYLLHLKNHDRPFECTTCPKKFLTNSGLQRHILLLHDRDNIVRKYSCEQCDKLFIQSSDLKRHKATVHSTEYNFACNVCFKRFKIRGDMKNHMRIHSTERPYECDKCDMKFKIKSGLNNHYRTHTGERPYKCDYCEKSFGDSSTCKAHIRIHTGEKPFECKHCDQRFIDGKSLRRHATKNHPDI